MFKRQEESSSTKHYLFNGEIRIQKKVIEKMEESGSIADLFSIIEDVKKRAKKEKGLLNPEQYYTHEKSGLELVIVDKISVEELEDDKVEKLYKSRNHYARKKLVK